MDNNFLPHFINETVYVIKEDTVAKEEKPTPVAEQPEEVKPAEVKPAETLVQKEPEAKPELRFKGNNQRSILILVDYPDHEHIDQADEAFLSKILQAIQVKIEESAILNLVSNNHFDYDTMLQFEAQHVLYFGTNKILPAQFVNYSIQSVSGKQILLSPALAHVAAATSEKKLLWGALKQMF